MTRFTWDDFAEGFFVWGSLIVCGWVGGQGYILAAVGLLALAALASIVLNAARAARAAALAEAAE